MVGPKGGLDTAVASVWKPSTVVQSIAKLLPYWQGGEKRKQDYTPKEEAKERHKINTSHEIIDWRMIVRFQVVTAKSMKMTSPIFALMIID